MRLEDIEKLRTVLQKITNACMRELSPLDRAEKDAATSLMSALCVAELTRASVLDAANAMREVLGLSPLTALEATTSLKDGLATAAAGSVSSRVPKVQATADIAALKDALRKLRSEAFEKACGEAAEAAAELGRDADSLHEVSREALLRSALDLFDDKVCPVCDTPFQPEEFREHVTAKLEQLDAVAAKRAALEAQIGPLLDALHEAGTALALLWQNYFCVNPETHSAAGTSFMDLHSEERLDDG
ncbi:MAG: ATP-binding protein, partial [Beijerinckiaceae bacterium]